MTRDTARHIEVGGLGIASLAEECASSSRGLTPSMGHKCANGISKREPDR